MKLIILKVFSFSCSFSPNLCSPFHVLSLLNSSLLQHAPIQMCLDFRCFCFTDIRGPWLKRNFQQNSSSYFVLCLSSLLHTATGSKQVIQFWVTFKSKTGLSPSLLISFSSIVCLSPRFKCHFYIIPSILSHPQCAIIIEGQHGNSLQEDPCDNC